ncbi:MAG: NTP transferase domain-containing protein [bacterium]
MDNHIIILAGGKGTRMKAECPKVLCKIKGISIIQHLLLGLGHSWNISIIIGHKGEEIIKKLGSQYHYIWQNEQLGTGHAVKCAMPHLIHKIFKNIIVIPGDHPFINAGTIRCLLNSREENNACISLASLIAPDFNNEYKSFYNCGRVIRDCAGNIMDIVEVKDAKTEEKLIKEVNVSQYCFDGEWLWKNIDKIDNNNNAKEYYLTDLIKIAFLQNKKVCSFHIKKKEGIGANTLEQISLLELLEVQD